MRLKSILIGVVVSVLLTLTSCVEGVIPDIFNPDSGETDDPQIEDPYGAEIGAYSETVTRLYEALSKHDVYNGICCQDAGATQLTRAFFVCQEQTTDACKCAWQDSYIVPMNTNTWGDEYNDVIFGVFFRTMQSIASCNEFLRQTTNDKLDARSVQSDVRAKIQEYRAEARMIRALCYWMAMDIFGDVPLVTVDSKEFDLNNRASAADVYQFIVDELELLSSDASALPAARSSYPRMDKGSALGLLARVYLNAQTYCGVPAWEKAKQTCERIFNLGYTLCDNYADMFRGDNGENYNAYNEFLMAIPFNTTNLQSYGGTTFLTCASIDQKYSNLIGAYGWDGICIDGDYVERFFDVRNANFETGEYECDDNRGKMFWIKGRLGEGKMPTNDEVYNFQYGWTCLKFNDIPHDQTKDTFKPINTFSSIDLPVIRLGEIYLIYAEACLRLGDGTPAQEYIGELAKRAGVDYEFNKLTSWNTEARDWFVAERARELMWESCRRTDLIRYDLFCSKEYLWPFKGGESRVGSDFPEYKKVFAIPSKQLEANPNLHNPEGYSAAAEENK